MKIKIISLLVVVLAVMVFADVQAAVPQPTAYWKMEEGLNANRQDSYGANHLVSVGEMQVFPGKINNSAGFFGSQYLSIADNAALSAGDSSFTIAGWFKMSDKNGVRVLASKRDSATNTEWMLIYEVALDRFRFFTFNGSTITGDVIANNFGSPAVDTWYYVVAWRDKAARKVNIQVNNGQVNSANETGAPSDSTASFKIGYTASMTTVWRGFIDEVGFWKRALTATERTELYNNGNGWGAAASAGGSPSPTPTPVPPPGTNSKIGDINKDGKVNSTDYNILVQNFGRTGANTSDLNKDGIVDVLDYNLLLWDYNYGY